MRIKPVEKLPVKVKTTKRGQKLLSDLLSSSLGQKVHSICDFLRGAFRSSASSAFAAESLCVSLSLR